MAQSETQIGQVVRLVWSASSLCVQWVAKDPSFLNGDSEDSDQTGQIVVRWLIFQTFERKFNP